MKYQHDSDKQNRGVSGYDYESAYSAAENAALNPKDARISRAESIEEELEKQESPRQTRARLRREEKKAKRVRVIIIIAAAAFIVALAAALAAVYINKAKEAEAPVEGIPVLETEEKNASVSEIYTYGTRLNISGMLPSGAAHDAEAIDLVLYNGEFISVPLIVSGETFTISEQYNGGLFLDSIPRETYTMFIRVTSYEPFEEPVDTDPEASQDMEEEDSELPEETLSESGSSSALEKKKPEESTEETTQEPDPDEDEAETEEEREKFFKYYTLVNESGYPETVYYTLSSTDNCIVIADENEYHTMQMTVSENDNDDVYDVVIDPGHGGQDKGAYGVDGHTEIEYLLPLAQKVKAALEKEGFKVALTRNSDSETLDIYGEDGRIARACSTEAKYMLCLHMNDSGTGQGGLEIYAYTGLDYTLAGLLNDNLQSMAGFADSVNVGQIGHNIYTQQFTQKDIEDLQAENTAAGLKPYEPTERSSYYFIIRESGGIVTGAFKDDRNPQEKYNPYCYDNTGIETYILQLGYITYEEDLNIVTTKADEIAAAIAEGMSSVYQP